LNENRFKSIELEVKRIKELNLSGEDTFLIACDLIEGLLSIHREQRRKESAKVPSTSVTKAQRVKQS